MAGGLTAYSTPDNAPEALDVDETRPSAKVIRIDGETGQVGIQNPDGSLEVIAPGGDKAPKDENFDANLAEDTNVSLSTICADLLEGIEADIKSRADWENTMNRGRDLLGVKLEDASSSVTAEGTISQVKDLGMLEAVLQSWANARAELLPASGPVKVSDDMPQIEAAESGATRLPAPGQPVPPKPTRSDLADALEKDMNHYLTVVDKEYVPDFSRMLLNRSLDGIQFRKVYRCPLRRRPVSVWVRGADLIVSNDAAHIQGAGRVTERMKMRQATVKRMMAIKHWRKVSLVQPTQTPSSTDQNIAMLQGVQAVPQLPADHLHEIYECYCELDNGDLALDENGRDVGFPLPYRVTIDKESRTILEIRRNWKQGDEDYKARRRYVKYGFVPGFGFYDWGLTHILGNPQRAATAIERMLIDAGMYCSFPGGLMAKGPGTRQRTTEIRPDPGSFEVIDTGGLPIQDVAMPLPYKEPSSVLQNMGTKITTDMRRIGGVLNMPVGEGRVGDVPVGTMMAYVDAIAKVPSAIHKDDHAAQQEEFELLKELFVEEPEALTAGVPARLRARANGYTAEELQDQDLVPKADPNIPSQVHRFMQTTALVEAGQSPMFNGIANPRGIWKRVVTVLGVQNPDDVTLPETAPAPPPPDPRIVAANLKLEGTKIEAQADAEKVQSNNELKQQEQQLETMNQAENRASDEKRAGMTLMGKVLDNKTKAEGNALSEGLGHIQHVQTLNQQDQQHQDNLASTPPPNPEGIGP